MFDKKFDITFTFCSSFLNSSSNNSSNVFFLSEEKTNMFTMELKKFRQNNVKEN